MVLKVAASLHLIPLWVLIFVGIHQECIWYGMKIASWHGCACILVAFEHTERQVSFSVGGSSVMVSITATTFHVQGFTIDTVGNMGWGSTSVCIGLVDGLSKLTAVLYAEAAVPLHW